MEPVYNTGKSMYHTTAVVQRIAAMFRVLTQRDTVVGMEQQRPQQQEQRSNEEGAIVANSPRGFARRTSTFYSELDAPSSSIGSASGFTVAPFEHRPLMASVTAAGAEGQGEVRAVVGGGEVGALLSQELRAFFASGDNTIHNRPSAARGGSMRIESHHRGGCWTVCGPRGSGKSHVLHMLCRQWADGVALLFSSPTPPGGSQPASLSRRLSTYTSTTFTTSSVVAAAGAAVAEDEEGSIATTAGSVASVADSPSSAAGWYDKVDAVVLLDVKHITAFFTTAVDADHSAAADASESKEDGRRKRKGRWVWDLLALGLNHTLRTVRSQARAAATNNNECTSGVGAEDGATEERVQPFLAEDLRATLTGGGNNTNTNDDDDNDRLHSSLRLLFLVDSNGPQADDASSDDVASVVTALLTLLPLSLCIRTTSTRAVVDRQGGHRRVGPQVTPTSASQHHTSISGKRDNFGSDGRRRRVLCAKSIELHGLLLHCEEHDNRIGETAMCGRCAVELQPRLHFLLQSLAGTDTCRDSIAAGGGGGCRRLDRLSATEWERLLQCCLSNNDNALDSGALVLDTAVMHALSHWCWRRLEEQPISASSPHSQHDETGSMMSLFSGSPYVRVEVPCDAFIGVCSSNDNAAGWMSMLESIGLVCAVAVPPSQTTTTTTATLFMARPLWLFGVAVWLCECTATGEAAAAAEALRLASSFVALYPSLRWMMQLLALKTATTSTRRPWSVPALGVAIASLEGRAGEEGHGTAKSSCPYVECGRTGGFYRLRQGANEARSVALCAWLLYIVDDIECGADGVCSDLTALRDVLRGVMSRCLRRCGDHSYDENHIEGQATTILTELSRFLWSGGALLHRHAPPAPAPLPLLLSDEVLTSFPITSHCSLDSIARILSYSVGQLVAVCSCREGDWISSSRRRRSFVTLVGTLSACVRQACTPVLTPVLSADIERRSRVQEMERLLSRECIITSSTTIAAMVTTALHAQHRSLLSLLLNANDSCCSEEAQALCKRLLDDVALLLSATAPSPNASEGSFTSCPHLRRLLLTVSLSVTAVTVCCSNEADRPMVVADLRRCLLHHSLRPPPRQRRGEGSASWDGTAALLQPLFFFLLFYPEMDSSNDDDVENETLLSSHDIPLALNTAANLGRADVVVGSSLPLEAHCHTTATAAENQPIGMPLAEAALEECHRLSWLVHPHSSLSILLSCVPLPSITRTGVPVASPWQRAFDQALCCLSSSSNDHAPPGVTVGGDDRSSRPLFEAWGIVRASLRLALQLRTTTTKTQSSWNNDKTSLPSWPHRAILSTCEAALPQCIDGWRRVVHQAIKTLAMGRQERGERWWGHSSETTTTTTTKTPGRRRPREGYYDWKQWREDCILMYQCTIEFGAPSSSATATSSSSSSPSHPYSPPMLTGRRMSSRLVSTTTTQSPPLSLLLQRFVFALLDPLRDYVALSTLDRGAYAVHLESLVQLRHHHRQQQQQTAPPTRLFSATCRHAMAKEITFILMSINTSCAGGSPKTASGVGGGGRSCCPAERRALARLVSTLNSTSRQAQDGTSSSFNKKKAATRHTLGPRACTVANHRRVDSEDDKRQEGDDGNAFPSVFFHHHPDTKMSQSAWWQPSASVLFSLTVGRCIDCIKEHCDLEHYSCAADAVVMLLDDVTRVLRQHERTEVALTWITDAVVPPLFTSFSQCSCCSCSSTEEGCSHRSAKTVAFRQLLTDTVWAWLFHSVLPQVRGTTGSMELPFAAAVTLLETTIRVTGVWKYKIRSAEAWCWCSTRRCEQPKPNTIPGDEGEAASSQQHHASWCLCELERRDVFLLPATGITWRMIILLQCTSMRHQPGGRDVDVDDSLTATDNNRLWTECLSHIASSHLSTHHRHALLGLLVAAVPLCNPATATSSESSSSWRRDLCRAVDLHVLACCSARMFSVGSGEQSIKQTRREYGGDDNNKDTMAVQTKQLREALSWRRQLAAAAAAMAGDTPLLGKQRHAASAVTGGGDVSPIIIASSWYTQAEKQFSMHHHHHDHRTIVSSSPQRDVTAVCAEVVLSWIGWQGALHHLVMSSLTSGSRSSKLFAIRVLGDMANVLLLASDDYAMVQQALHTLRGGFLMIATDKSARVRQALCHMWRSVLIQCCCCSKHNKGSRGGVASALRHVFSLEGATSEKEVQENDVVVSMRVRMVKIACGDASLDVRLEACRLLIAFDDVVVMMQRRCSISDEGGVSSLPMVMVAHWTAIVSTVVSPLVVHVLPSILIRHNSPSNTQEATDRTSHTPTLLVDRTRCVFDLLSDVARVVSATILLASAPSGGTTTEIGSTVTEHAIPSPDGRQRLVKRFYTLARDAVWFVRRAIIQTSDAEGNKSRNSRRIASSSSSSSSSSSYESMLQLLLSAATLVDTLQSSLESVSSGSCAVDSRWWLWMFDVLPFLLSREGRAEQNIDADEDEEEKESRRIEDAFATVLLRILSQSNEIVSSRDKTHRHQKNEATRVVLDRCSLIMKSGPPRDPCSSSSSRAFRCVTRLATKCWMFVFNKHGHDIDAGDSFSSSSSSSSYAKTLREALGFPLPSSRNDLGNNNRERTYAEVGESTASSHSTTTTTTTIAAADSCAAPLNSTQSQSSTGCLDTKDNRSSHSSMNIVYDSEYGCRGNNVFPPEVYRGVFDSVMEHAHHQRWMGTNNPPSRCCDVQQQSSSCLLETLLLDLALLSEDSSDLKTTSTTCVHDDLPDVHARTAHRYLLEQLLQWSPESRLQSIAHILRWAAHGSDITYYDDGDDDATTSVMVQRQLHHACKHVISNRAVIEVWKRDGIMDRLVALEYRGGGGGDDSLEEAAVATPPQRPASSSLLRTLVAFVVAEETEGQRHGPLVPEVGVKGMCEDAVFSLLAVGKSGMQATDSRQRISQIEDVVEAVRHALLRTNNNNASQPNHRLLILSRLLQSAFQACQTLFHEHLLHVKEHRPPDDMQDTESVCDLLTRVHVKIADTFLECMPQWDFCIVVVDGKEKRCADDVESPSRGGGGLYIADIVSGTYWMPLLLVQPFSLSKEEEVVVSGCGNDAAARAEMAVCRMTLQVHDWLRHKCSSDNEDDDDVVVGEVYEMKPLGSTEPSIATMFLPFLPPHLHGATRHVHGGVSDGGGVVVTLRHDDGDERCCNEIVDVEEHQTSIFRVSCCVVPPATRCRWAMMEDHLVSSVVTATAARLRRHTRSESYPAAASLVHSSATAQTPPTARRPEYVSVSACTILSKKIIVKDSDGGGHEEEDARRPPLASPSLALLSKIARLLFCPQQQRDGCVKDGEGEEEDQQAEKRTIPPKQHANSIRRVLQALRDDVCGSTATTMTPSSVVGFYQLQVPLPAAAASVPTRPACASAARVVVGVPSSASLTRIVYRHAFAESLRRTLHAAYTASVVVSSDVVDHIKTSTLGKVGSVMSAAGSAVPIIGSAVAALGKVLDALDHMSERQKLDNIRRVALHESEAEWLFDVIAHRVAQLEHLEIADTKRPIASAAATNDRETTVPIFLFDALEGAVHGALQSLHEALHGAIQKMVSGVHSSYDVNRSSVRMLLGPWCSSNQRSDLACEDDVDEEKKQQVEEKEKELVDVFKRASLHGADVAQELLAWCASGELRIQVTEAMAASQAAVTRDSQLQFGSSSHDFSHIPDHIHSRVVGDVQRYYAVLAAVEHTEQYVSALYQEYLADNNSAAADSDPAAGGDQDEDDEILSIKEKKAKGKDKSSAVKHKVVVSGGNDVRSFGCCHQ